MKDVVMLQGLVVLCVWVICNMNIDIPSREMFSPHAKPSSFEVFSPPKLAEMSVIMVCFKENAEHIVKSLNSILKMDVAKKIIKEVIIFDDGGGDHLREVISELCTPAEIDTVIEDESAEVKSKRDMIQKCNQNLDKVTFVGSNTRVGFAKGRNIAARTATSEFLFFTPPRIHVDDFWLGSLLRQLNINPKRVAIPVVQPLDEANWTILDTNRGAKVIFSDWSLNTQYFDDGDTPSPLIPESIFAVSRDFYHQLEGTDSSHLIPSTHDDLSDTLEFSIKTWLCGGEIGLAREAIIGLLDYPDDSTNLDAMDDLVNNRVKVVEGWLGSYKNNFYAEEKELKPMGRSEVTDEIFHLQNRLHCKDFSFFVQQFEHLFHAKNLLPRDIFQIKTHNKHCLTVTKQHGKQFIIPQTCDENNPNQQISYAENNKAFRFSNAGCLDSGNALTPGVTPVVLLCHRRDHNQYFDFDAEDGRIRWGSLCLEDQGLGQLFLLQMCRYNNPIKLGLRDGATEFTAEELEEFSHLRPVDQQLFSISPILPKVKKEEVEEIVQ